MKNPTQQSSAICNEVAKQAKRNWGGFRATMKHGSAPLVAICCCTVAAAAAAAMSENSRGKKKHTNENADTTLTNEGRSVPVVPLLPGRRQRCVFGSVAEKGSQQARHLHSRSYTLATSAANNNNNDNEVTSDGTEMADADNPKYDFIIVGFGNAGTSALATLREQCPSASIAVVDSHHSVPLKNYDNIHFLSRCSVTNLDHSQQTIHFVHNRQGKLCSIQYNCSLLIATGCRGAPPPPSLFDNRAQVLELRSTRPDVLVSPQEVRALTLMAASQGAKICVLGSGLEALELAAFYVTLEKLNGAKKETCGTGMKHLSSIMSKNSGSSNHIDDANVTLAFGSAGPLANRIPRYLSAALSKRLRQFGINVLERSLVRYVTSANVGSVEVHLAKSYDTLDTSRVSADLLIVAPSVQGQRGTAVLPTQLSTSFQPWSKMSSNVLTCYSDDGRIMVNSELSAASKVYAAGSVAKYPNHGSGHAAVAGDGGGVNAAFAGEVAANNMACEYYERTMGGMAKKATRFINTNESFPVWRTDTCSYVPKEDQASMSLASLGVHALCVGHCDSETMATHGFWWTNQASDIRRRATIRDTAISSGWKKGDLRRRRLTNLSGGERSVYGSGVMYYLDRVGVIRGVMTWGLPFANADGNLKTDLFNRMTKVILTNGEVMIKDHLHIIKEDPRTVDPTRLHVLHLSEESKVIAALAFAGDLPPQWAISVGNDTNTTTGTSKPLHRYSPSKPASITSVGNLKRTYQTGHGGIGDDIFIQSDSTRAKGKEVVRLPSLAHVYSGDREKIMESFMLDDDRDEIDELSSNTRARPPKEEPLWLRVGDYDKTVSMREALANAFMLTIRHGRLKDGSDVVKQAPVPQFVQDAKNTYKKWTTGGNTVEGDYDDDDDDDDLGNRN